MRGCGEASETGVTAANHQSPNLQFIFVDGLPWNRGHIADVEMELDELKDEYALMQSAQARDDDDDDDDSGEDACVLD